MQRAWLAALRRHRRPPSGTRWLASSQPQASSDQLATVTLTVNGHAVTVPAGLALLETARAAGVSIPTLCAHPRSPGVKGLCRVCLVERRVGGEGASSLVPACASPAEAGLDIHTDTPAVETGRRAALALLRAEGHHDCTACEASGGCELQDLLRRYSIVDGGGVVAKDADSHEWAAASDDDGDDFHRHALDASSDAIRLDLSKCIECGRCVFACSALNVLGLVGRGPTRHVATVGDTPLADSPCISCGQCSLACPTGALEAVPHWRAVCDAIDNGKLVVCQVAPAARVSAAEVFGLPPGALSAGALVAALRAAGFAHVFSTNTGADITTVEEAAELLDRLTHGRGPGLTSCCPAWVTLAEREYPDLVPHLSTTKSPMTMMGSLIKSVWARSVGVPPSSIVSVAIMPCTAKKAEAGCADLALPDGTPPVDFVLTVRELGRLLRFKHIPVGGAIPESAFDAPLGDASGAAELFAASGGVAEAATRTLSAWLSDGKGGPRVGATDNGASPPPRPPPLTPVRGLAGVKEAVIPLPPVTAAALGGRSSLRVGVAAGIGAARTLLDRVRAGEKFDAIEIMACPGGCVGGGGQPKSRDATILAKRAAAVYALDRDAAVASAQDNPAVAALYARELGRPGSAAAHALLHRKYGKKAGK